MNKRLSAVRVNLRSLLEVCECPNEGFMCSCDNVCLKLFVRQCSLV
jgi:hypothetical protein